MALPTFTMRQLLEAGVHFGHTTRRWNPKMEPFIYGERNDIHILDLQQTVPLLSRALEAVRNVVANGGRVLMVGTKRQASEYVAEAAARCGQYYVNHRWLGGMLTNWKTISHSIKRLRQVQEILDEGGAGLTKKETLNLTRERDKLERALGGIKDMGGLPDLIFIIDTNKEHLAINEANKLGIPVAAVLDSNSDPYGITYPIPGNDDALRAISLYCELVGDAVLDGIQAEMQGSGEDPGAAEDAGEKIPEEAELAEAAPQSAEGAGDSQAAEGQSAETQSAETQTGDGPSGASAGGDGAAETTESQAKSA
jgi:small subunit ribosomal protein S2